MCFAIFAPMIKRRILQFIGFFYGPFKKLVPLQTFRYAVCGGANTLFDLFLFFISYHYILEGQVIYTGLPITTGMSAISPHIAAFLMAFLVSFPTGYVLNRFIVFPGSVLRGRVQLFRYFLLVLTCIILNYYFIKLFVEQFHIYPTVSKMLTTVIVVSFSYVTQKKFTFKAQEV